MHLFRTFIIANFSISRVQLPVRYNISIMNSQPIPGGVVHTLPTDLRKSLKAHPEALQAWRDITPLARNEWICWVEGAKLIETRARRIERAHTELVEGKRRPCCWPGCMHREKNGKA